MRHNMAIREINKIVQAVRLSRFRVPGSIDVHIKICSAPLCCDSCFLCVCIMQCNSRRHYLAFVYDDLSPSQQTR